MRLRSVALLTAGLALLAPTAAARASSSGGPPRCTSPTLVLSAMPLELGPLLEAASVDPADTVRVDDRTFYVGELGGADVVLAMTGIGLVNAAETTEAAIEHFRCPFRAAVFSGVAGSRAFIGDVMVPARWSMDEGETWTDVDARMLSVASHLQGDSVVPLSRDVPVGDAACVCPGVETSSVPVTLPQAPKVRAGGEGVSYDTFSGHAVPCLPGGGDVAGCEPCLGPASGAQDALDFAANAPPLVDTAFVQGFLTAPESTTQTYASQDMETAAFAAVAAAHGLPFLGVRAVSDGRNDPLSLPGFPAQFFTYRQLAGDNAAATTIAFLESWTAQGQPVGPPLGPRAG